MWDEGHIGEYLPCSARLAQTRSSALWTFVKFGVQTSIANTRIDATCKLYGLDAGERLNMRSCLGKILHACLGKDVRHIIEGQVG